MDKNIKILLIEDSLGDARIFYEYLKEASAGKIEITHNLKLSSGLESLAKKMFDIIVLDLDLSDSNGLDTLRKLRESVKHIPVIIHSGQSDLETAIKAMKYGAQDYIIKGRFEGDTIYRIIRFVLERKKIEERLIESEKKFTATFEQTAVGMAHFNLQRKWIRVNDKLCSITGYTKEELYHSDFQSITHPEDIQQDIELTKKLSSGEIETYSLEKRYLHKNGSSIWVNSTVSMVLTADGKLDFFVEVIEDISTRKKLEAQLLELESKK